ncbi:alpha/beta hydrolase fold domain-containing protein [Actinoplanes sp. NPDC051494]|uniref:alpha/beta hydrolase fold domain-containing protein n=1 Tax=Actinoplanes sp. NPDC051494 TaxID=3363907 RepID=UPI0037A62120
MRTTDVPGPHGPVPVRIYEPPGPARAALLWAHGGGFRHGDLAMPEADMVGAELASAGAALALATAVRARDTGRRTPDVLLLAYPFVHFPVPTLGLDRTLASIEDMVRNYVGRISDLPPDALPGAARLDALAPTHILLSEHDDLRPSGELLGRQLREAGVPVTTHLARGTTHGHLNRPADHPEGVEQSLVYLAGALMPAGR